MEPRLRSEVWVKAQIRQCDVQSIPAVVARRGDSDGGAIYLRIDRRDAGCELLSRTYGPDGERIWYGPIGDGPLPPEKVDAYLEKQATYDPDFWVLDIDDPDGRYEPFGIGV